MSKEKVGENEPVLEIHRPTLAEFIEDNYKLITVLGVFTALTVYIGSTPLKPLTQVISFFFLTLAVFVWVELWGRFPESMGTLTLFWFENVFSLSAIAIVIYWFLTVGCVFPPIIMISVFLLVMSVISIPIKKFQLFNRIFRSEPGKGRILRIVLGVSILLMAYAIGVLFSSLISVRTYMPFLKLLVTLGCTP